MNLRMSKIAEVTRRARNGGHGAVIGHYAIVKDEDRQHVQVVYRGTVVAAFSPSTVVLNAGGWHTPTTKAVMNAALAFTPYRVRQRQWKWFVDELHLLSPVGQPHGIKRTIPFVDQMMLPLSV